MAEFHRARAQANQPGVLRRAQPGQVDAEPGRRPFQSCQVAGAADRRQHQGLPGLRVQQARTPQKRTRDPGRDHHRGVLGRQHQVPVPGVHRQLAQRQRVSRRGLVQPPDRLGGQPGSQQGRFLKAKPADPEYR